MSILPWSSLMSVKIDVIDQQHKKLLDIVNEVYSGVVFGRTVEIFEDSFPELLNYAKMHFGTEERLMEIAGFEGLDKHKEQHRELSKKLTDIHDKIAAGEQVDYEQICTFLSSWLATHMMGEDQEYVEVLAMLDESVVGDVCKSVAMEAGCA